MIFPLELETEAQDWLERYAGFNKGFEPVVFDLAEGSTDPLFPYTAGSFGSGANMAFRTDVLRGMRGFEPALGAGTEAKGGDDLAAFFDVIAAGHAIAYEPAAIVYHEHHRTFDALRRQTFGYGVGLSAYLTKTVLDDPDRLWDMLGRAPKALHHALSPKSAKNDRLPLDTPRTLVRRERLGMLVGPALYLLSRSDTQYDPRPGPVAAVIDLDEDPRAWRSTSPRSSCTRRAAPDDPPRHDPGAAVPLDRGGRARGAPRVGDTPRAVRGAHGLPARRRVTRRSPSPSTRRSSPSRSSRRRTRPS